jgi:hypothetical protein
VTLIDGALVLGVAVLIPVTAPLVPGAGARTARIAVVVAVPAALALVTGAGGTLGALLVLPWTVATVAAAALLALRWWGSGRRLRELPWPAAAGYLAFGSLWLLADRLELEPGGFGPPFVQLTAVHFLYAGFVATVLAARLHRRFPSDRLATTAVVGTVTAPPVVAIGFAAVGVLQIVGAVLLTVATYALAWVTLRRLVPRVGAPAGWLLAISSVSVLVPMLLAVQWAVGANLGTPALSVPAMTRTHGVANALGFALLGALGWRSLDRSERRQEVAETTVPA